MSRFPWLLVEAGRTAGGLNVRVDSAAGVHADSRLVVEELGQGWAAPSTDPADQTVIEWTDDRLSVRTSRQNFTPLYYWIDERRQRVQLCTDLALLTAHVGMRVADLPAEQVLRRRAARAHIRTIGGHRLVSFESRDGELFHSEHALPGWHASDTPDETAAAAGSRQLDALAADIAAVRGPGQVTALVSGGVDSGVVAALAQQAGALDGLATLGTVWGDERGEAEELGRVLGHPVRYVLLSEDDMLTALPETIRMLGEPGRETVAIASNLVALFRSGTVPVGTLLTGYGSDLLNSGLRVEAGVAAQLRTAVYAQMEHASTSAEFAGTAAAAHGYRVRHPFWSSPVIQAALDTSSALTSYRGREKGHLREAATRLLPGPIAWRRKQALHRGSGVDENLDQAIARRIGAGSVDVARLYELIQCTLVQALTRAPHDEIDAPKCLETAMSAYSASS